MFQNLVWRSIFEHFGAPKCVQKHFLTKTNLFLTNYSKPLRQPWVNLVYRVYLKHRNSILKCWKVCFFFCRNSDSMSSVFWKHTLSRFCLCCHASGFFQNTRLIVFCLCCPADGFFSNTRLVVFVCVALRVVFFLIFEWFFDRIEPRECLRRFSFEKWRRMH